MTEAAPSLNAVHESIDAIDRKLVRLFVARGKLVHVAAAAADAGDAAVPDPERVIARVRGLAADAGLDPEVAEATWRAMIERSLCYRGNSSTDR